MIKYGRHIRMSLLCILVFLIFVTVGVLIFFLFPTASNQGYAPEQPIPFSHKKHAGTHKIACLYCHAGAEKSRHATLPALSVCMNCHSVVKTESPHIQKLIKHYAEKKPVEWIRVHEEPDFVYFSHKRHVKKGVSCETCHGFVKEMDRMVQKAPLTMGWCLDCHRGITTPKGILKKITPGKTLPPGHVADTNCTTCHQ
jgi:hypothetical protein